MKMRITQWIILVLLILILFHPVFHFKKDIPLYGILLIDESESMRNIKKRKIKTIIPIKTFNFGKNKNGTDIGNAITEASEKYPEASFIILFSDGSNTKGKNPIEIAGKVGLPIYIVFPEEYKYSAGFISVYGPNSALEGDSVKINIHYKVPDKATIEIRNNEKTNKKDINKEGILTFSILPSAGKNTIQVDLLIENKIIDNVIWSIDVKQKRKLLILTEVPNWNYKFIKRYFEDKRWKIEDYKKDNIKDENIFDYNIICVLDNPEKYKEKIEKYLLKGGNVVVVSSSSPNLDFLPLITSTLSKYRGELPEAYYLKPGGVKNNTKNIELSGEKVGYSIVYGKGTVTQLIYLELWKLALLDKNLYKKDYFKELMDNLTGELIQDESSVSYSKKLPEGEDFILKFNKNKDSEKSFFWDGQKIPITEDSILIKNPSKGSHHFRIEIESQSIEDSVLIVAEGGDKMGIDSTMLSSIADISGGGEWDGSLGRENFQVKKRELWINLRHNWLFIIFLLLLLFSDWVLWMRKNS
jgi:hypothetical protein